MKKSTLRISLIATSLLLGGYVWAQVNERGEQWEPVPVEVTGAPDGAPPSDAIVLFDGSNMNAWETALTGEPVGWDVAGSAVTIVPGTGTIRTRRSFGDIQLHIEWRPTDVIQGSGQGRGNSGVFLHSLFELQVLDSWNNPTYVNGQAGSVYKQYAPLVNASRAPGQWQSFDVIFKAPQYDSRGNLVSPAYMTVFHNGVLIQDNVEIKGASFTPTPQYAARCEPYPNGMPEQDCSGHMPITLQDHGQVVSFRNIWLRQL